MLRIAILNGPNLNMLRTRDPVLPVEFRQHSVIASVCQEHIVELGWRGYVLALDALVDLLHEQHKGGVV